MREIRKSGSEGGGAGYSTGSPYPYQGRSNRPSYPMPKLARMGRGVRSLREASAGRHGSCIRVWDERI
jgi:hypothetical protein